MNVTPPAVSQRLKLLEEKLAVKLLERVRGAICLTSEGALLLEKAQGILGDLEDLEDVFSLRRDHVSGPLRIIASFGFGRKHVASIMASFQAQHPDITLSLRLSEAPSITGQTEPWDIMISIGALPASSIIQRKLASNRRILCAAPSYLQLAPRLEQPSDLKAHACGVIRENHEDVTLWAFSTLDNSGVKTVVTQRIDPAFASNDGDVVVNWARQGLGVIERSQWDVAAELQSGRLRQVLPGFDLPSADIIALTSPRMLRVARTQRFLDHLAHEVKHLEPHWVIPD